MAKIMDIWMGDNCMKIAVTNVPEFNELLERARKEARQLQNTVDELSNFVLTVTVSNEVD